MLQIDETKIDRTERRDKQIYNSIWKLQYSFVEPVDTKKLRRCSNIEQHHQTTGFN